MPYVRPTRCSLHTPILVAAALHAVVLGAPAAAQAAASRGARPPTVADAAAFMARAESLLNDLAVKAARADWVANTYITFDSEELTAQAQEVYGVATRDLATQARRYERLRLPPDLKRKFLLLKLSLPAPPPPDAREAAELTRLTSSTQADYGKGTYCRTPQECLQISDIERIMASSRDPAELAAVWQGSHRISVAMRDRYARFVTLANAGARGLGFADVGVMWRAGYDMPGDAFVREIDRLWDQLKPPYLPLHPYLRARLGGKDGAGVGPPKGRIPAHPLGNLWAQDRGDSYDLLAPSGVPPGGALTRRP